MSNTVTHNVEYIRCPRCKGLKQVAGLGGLTRDCLQCDGKGKIEQPVLMSVSHYQEQGEKFVSSLEAAAPVAKDISVPNESDVIPADKVINEPVLSSPTGVTPKQVDSKGREIIFPGYDNDLMEAVLAEPRMSTQEWKEKYKNVPGAVAMGLRERAALRELYALSKPVAPRKVNLMASQDKVAEADPAYRQQVAKEKKKNGQ